MDISTQDVWTLFMSHGGNQNKNITRERKETGPQTYLTKLVFPQQMFLNVHIVLSPANFRFEAAQNVVRFLIQ